MKPYENFKLTEYPDKADLAWEGRASAVGNIPNQSGEYRRQTRSTKRQQAIRRTQRKQDRSRLKQRIWDDYREYGE